MIRDKREPALDADLVDSANCNAKRKGDAKGGQRQLGIGKAGQEGMQDGVGNLV